MSEHQVHTNGQTVERGVSMATTRQLFKRAPENVSDEVRVMWPNGPSRKYNVATGKRGSYVCQGCQRPTIGVYRVLVPVQVANRGIVWICGKCKNRKMQNGKLKGRAN